MQKVLQAVFFTVFFAVGAATVAVSVLSEDLLRYYRNRQLLQQAQKVLFRLEALNSDYDALLKELDSDPDLVKRLAPAALGASYQDPNAVYPKARAAELAAARRALTKAAIEEPNEPAVPRWVERCNEHNKRTVLFICGAALVLIALVCFSPAGGGAQEQSHTGRAN